MARLRVRVQPGAKRSEVVGWQEDVLRVRVSAPASEGRANQALIELLAELLGVPKSTVRLARGASGRDKVVDVDGLAADAVASRLPKS